MSVSFVHLGLHTEFSLEDSLIRIDSLMVAAKARGFPALALTDHMNLFAVIKFYKAAMAAGIKPILGADIVLANARVPTQPFHCTLLCQNFKGYQHLIQLISRAYLEGQQSGQPQVQMAWLAEFSEGLIALSGGLLGHIGQALLQGKTQLAEQHLQAWQALFPNRFYIELQRTARAQEQSYLMDACVLAQTHQVPVVATNDVRFLEAADFEAHEARVCIQQAYTLHDPKRPRRYSAEQYLRSATEMLNLFADIPTALSNTVEIAKRCNVEIPLNNICLPHFSVPAGVTAEAYLAQQTEQGLAKRLGINAVPAAQSIPENRLFSEQQLAAYDKRLASELAVINTMGFAGYFLIVADFIHWAKQQQIPVGPGRGSGAGSLVAYALQITDVDPLHYDLLFERFLNPERVSLPDFDIDFCMEGRDRVIAYVMQRYGQEAVAQIITFGTMAARAVVRDVGRVLGYPYGMVDAIAKLIPFEVGMTLEKALKQEANLRARCDQDEEVKILMTLARKLEGLARNAGTHAGGLVIAPSRLTDFTPLYCEPEAAHGITQLDKDDIEAVGLVKFDFLGLRTLTIIHWAVTAINQKRLRQAKTALDLSQLPLDDPETFALLRACQATAIFQLESRGIRGLLKRLAPTHFDDIVALLALFRPGPLQSGMVEDFISRKHQKTQIQYPHPCLEPILRPTYGIILYQEQVMQIAQLLAGYTLGAADLLRRAMGKKKPEEMAKQRAFFIAGAQKKGFYQKLADDIFDLVEKFAGYGFNKSHSVAYALISYQTAWLKAHYPAEFMAAVLSSEMERTEKLAALCYECRAMGLTITPPDINRSHLAFTVDEQDHIQYGLAAIKGLGHAMIEGILQARQLNGPFQDLFEFCRRLNTVKINRRALEALICSGSLDSLEEDRSLLFAQLEPALQAATQHAAAEGQTDLFGTALPTLSQKPINISAWTAAYRWQKEREVLGMYVSSHPITQYAAELAYLKLITLHELTQISARQTLLVAAWLVQCRTILTTRGDRFAILTLEDLQYRLELRLSDTNYQRFQAQLIKDQILILEVATSQDQVSGETRLNVNQLWDIAHARQAWSKGLSIQLKKDALHAQSLDHLQQALQLAKGGECPVLIEYHTATAHSRLALGEKWKVMPTDALLTQLQQYFGEASVCLEYGALGG